MNPRSVAIALAMLVSGCLPDLSPWEVVLPGVDAGPVTPGRDAGTGGPCALPYLLVATENLNGGAGMIARYELPAEGGVRACAPLSGQGQLMQQPFSIAAPSDRFVLAAGRDGAQGIDPATDTVRFTIPRSGQHPNDAFVLRDASHADWIAGVAWSNIGSSSIARGAIVNVAGYTIDGEQRWQWDGSALGVSSSIALASAPGDLGKLVAVHPSNWAAAVLDPFAGTIQSSPPLVGPIAGTAIETIAAGTGGGASMIAWGGRVDGEPRLLTLDAPYTGTVSQVTCAEQGCTFVHVAIDPTRPRAVIAICEEPGATERSIVRLDFANMVCEPLVPLESVPSRMRFSYLAFAVAR